jgi:hypothetical protein
MDSGVALDIADAAWEACEADASDNAEANTAWAAWDTAWAAWRRALKQCARIIRKYYPHPPTKGGVE